MGEKLPRILPKVVTSTSLLGSFTCRKFTTWDRQLRILLPKKSDSFSRVWTRELGYQRPAHLPLDHRSHSCWQYCHHKYIINPYHTVPGVPIHLNIWAWKVKVWEFPNFHSQQSMEITITRIQEMVVLKYPWWWQKNTAFWEVTLHYVVYVLKYSKSLRTVLVWVITQWVLAVSFWILEPWGWEW